MALLRSFLLWALFQGACAKVSSVSASTCRFFFGSVEEKECGILRSKEKTLRTSTSTSVPLTCDDFGYFSA